ncbi:hypothetical protein HPP92_014546 [Vanilla planifolia]|uniref:NAC domain-containing protein n=1 Tax=Vanilla planifolia TaxID=51239 RepID=A0A835UT93_VANPL|nr:hypothetical protein HPP92_014995 [Vanilla planifolia]KAG0474860.1 hypothetical protein HPP92_014546 [Vanilla planifolia]
MDRTASEMDLPGFRFHPTEEELLEFYLRRAAAGKKLNFDIIATVNLYLYDPWDLPALARMGEREWYFFVPRDRRQANGGRPNRTTDRGFWKATGSDRPIRSAANPRRLIGLKKTLVYYRGRAPRGTKTDWIMNEYRLPNLTAQSSSHPPTADIVLCRVYRKATSLKELEQRAAMQEQSRAEKEAAVSATSSDRESFQMFGCDHETKEEFEVAERSTVAAVSILQGPSAQPRETIPVESQAGRPNLPALQVPNRTGVEWVQSPFANQLRSPWLDQWSPLYANLLNF